MEPLDVRYEPANDRLAKLLLRSGEGREFKAQHWGSIIAGNCVEVHFVAPRDIPLILKGDKQTIERYVRSLPAGKPDAEMFYLNNRSYMIEEGNENPLLITDAYLEEQPREPAERSTN
jgi:hypothetical protein